MEMVETPIGTMLVGFASEIQENTLDERWMMAPLLKDRPGARALFVTMVVDEDLLADRQLGGLSGMLAEMLTDKIRQLIDSYEPETADMPETSDVKVPPPPPVVDDPELIEHFDGG